MLEFDHIAVSGETLEEAVELCEAALGVRLQPGGKHETFGTHNALLQIGKDLYLEAIATDPEAPAPDRPRWFDLDNFSGRARPTNWVCRTADLTQALGHLSPGVGEPVALSRSDLRWLMAVPEDGKLPFDGCHPAIIQWQSPTHPGAILKDRDVQLRRLTVTHPEAQELSALLKPLLPERHVIFEDGEPGLSAEFDTPHGTRVIERA